MKSGCIVVLVTCSSRREADRIGRALLKKRLVACVNIAGSVDSRFWWKGALDTARETVIMAKTTERRFPGVEKEVRRLHSYDVPEIIALPIIRGSAAYLDWIRDNVKRPR